MWAIDRTTSCTQNDWAKRYFGQLRTSCSSLSSGFPTNGRVVTQTSSKHHGCCEPRATISKRHMKVKLWESVDRESQGGEQEPAWGHKVGYGGGGEGGEEGSFVERIVVAQVRVHTLMGWLGRPGLKGASWVTDCTSPTGPTLAKVSVLTQDSRCLYYCPGFKRRAVGSLECLNI